MVTDSSESRALTAIYLVRGRMTEIQCITGETMPSRDGLLSYRVLFADGVEEWNRGSLLEISTLASLAGLHLAHSEAGTFRFS